jgi:hypothetical protein
MLTLRKILKIKFFKEYIFSFLFLFTLILNGKELFHNHEFSLIEPEDCPVLIFNNNSESYSIDETLVESIIPTQNYYPQTIYATVLKSTRINLHLRAPPIL